MVDLLGHQLREHSKPDPDAQGQQAFLCRAGQLAERLLHTYGQRVELRVIADLVGAFVYVFHGGSLGLDDLAVRHADRYHGVMSVKEHSDIVDALGRAESALHEATADLEHTRASVLELVGQQPGITVAELASQFHLSEDAIVAFVRTVGELLGEERGLSVEAARRGALLAAASQAWENELGPLLDTTDVRELLEVSRQRVDELLRSRRLIALPDGAGRRRYPTFQFHDGRPLASLISAFWTIADVAISPWTAASWCTARDEDALGGRSPVAWARSGRDAEHLARVARQDAARLER